MNCVLSTFMVISEHNINIGTANECPGVSRRIEDLSVLAYDARILVQSFRASHKGGRIESE
jgi:hypothetical protein